MFSSYFIELYGVHMIPPIQRMPPLRIAHSAVHSTRAWHHIILTRS
jgi:hypothetical protein